MLSGSTTAGNIAASIASIAIYVLMAAILLWKPRGLFPAHA